MGSGWGTKKKGCRVGLAWDDDIEYNAAGSQARIVGWDLKFSSDSSICDTTNTTSVSGGAIADNSWSKLFNKSSNWSGTMTLKSNVSSQWVNLSFGSPATATAKIELEGIAVAGGDLTYTKTFTFPSRKYNAVIAPLAPTVSVSGNVVSITRVPTGVNTNTPASDRYSDAYIVQTSTDNATWTNVVGATPWSTTMVSHLGVNSGTPRYYRVVAATAEPYLTQYTNGESTENIWEIPAAPTINVVRSADNGHAWTVGHSADGVGQAYSFIVEEQTNGSDWTVIYEGTSKTGTWTGGSANNYYKFRARAVNAAGTSANSSETGAIYNSVSAPIGVSAGSPTVTTPHGTAYNTTKQSSQSLLSWGHVATTYVTNFRIYLNGSLIASPANSATSYTVTGLVPGTQYSVLVAAYNSGFGEVGTPLTIGAVPDVPDGVSTPSLGAFSTGGGKAAATLTWPAVAGANGYWIDAEGGYIDQHSATNSLSLTNLNPGTTYTFRISAKNAVGYGGFGSTVSATTPTVPAAPTGLAVNYDAGVLSALWGVPGNGGATITGYKYRIRANDETPTWEDWVSIDTTSFSVVRADTPTNFSVQVAAVNGIGDSEISEEESGLVGGYVRVYDVGGSGWDGANVYLRNGADTMNYSVRVWDGTKWVPTIY